MPHKDPEKKRQYKREWQQKKMLNDPEYAKRKKDRDKERKRERRQEDHDYAQRINLYNKEYKKKQIIDNPHYHKEYSLSRRYGLSVEQKQALYDTQNGCCPICKKAFENLSDAFVDHEHVKNENRSKRIKRTVRGLLCNGCNLALGQFQDNISFLSNAIDYLRKFEVIEEEERK